MYWRGRGADAEVIERGNGETLCFDVSPQRAIKTVRGQCRNDISILLFCLKFD